MENNPILRDQVVEKKDNVIKDDLDSSAGKRKNRIAR